ncbi:antibiotic biosynthesis monooxygenase [Streptomyces sp. HUAS MG91]|uniref:Antibiotic biosynthesis monooxygenase n=1 Tax=Streptomyces tabacisoli TaxID=3156398 RepID=A0AAU8IX80_9ACTN
MTTQTVEYIRYRIPEARSAEFLSAYTRASRLLAASPHCVAYELDRCEEDFEHYVLRIVWTSTADHVEGFRTSELFPDFLAEIRPYVGNIDEMRHYKPTTVRGKGSAEPTLYERAGGAEGLARLVSAFHARAVRDELLGPLVAELPDEYADHVALWLAEMFGGPGPSGQSRMVAWHAGREISAVQWRRWVNLMHDAADEAGLPSSPAFRSAFAGCLEWGAAPPISG